MLNDYVYHSGFPHFGAGIVVDVGYGGLVAAFGPVFDEQGNESCILVGGDFDEFEPFWEDPDLPDQYNAVFGTR